MLNRAFLSIRRQYLKTFLLMISFIVLFTTMAMTSFIIDASGKSIRQMRESFGSLVSIFISSEKANEIRDAFKNPDSSKYVTIYREGNPTMIRIEEDDPLPFIEAIDAISQSPYLKR